MLPKAMLAPLGVCGGLTKASILYFYLHPTFRATLRRIINFSKKSPFFSNIIKKKDKNCMIPLRYAYSQYLTNYTKYIKKNMFGFFRFRENVNLGMKVPKVLVET